MYLVEPSGQRLKRDIRFRNHDGRVVRVPGDRDPTAARRIPETSGSIVDMLRRDLDGAGIAWRLPSGEVVDFHTFRSTCITWWLDVDGLRPKRVQVLARLKGLGMVQNYSRNLRLDDFGWLDNGPKLVTARRKRSA